MKRIFLVAIIALLSACAHQSLAPAIANRAQYQQQLDTLDHWQLDGKIAVRHADKADSAAVHWQQDSEQFDIFLSGPLGAGATRFTGNPKQLTIHNSSEETTDTADPEALVEKHLGWTLPLDQLPKWIVGTSTAPDAVFNPDNTLASFSLHGWRVRYLTYTTVDHWLLPEKIVLVHDDMQVTIVIKQWELHQRE